MLYNKVQTQDITDLSKLSPVYLEAVTLIQDAIAEAFQSPSTKKKSMALVHAFAELTLELRSHLEKDAEEGQQLRFVVPIVRATAKYCCVPFLCESGLLGIARQTLDDDVLIGFEGNKTRLVVRPTSDGLYRVVDMACVPHVDFNKFSWRLLSGRSSSHCSKQTKRNHDSL